MKMKLNIKVNIILLLSISILALTLSACSTTKAETGTSENVGDSGITKEESEYDKNYLYLGNEESENEMVLVFDYSCPYCYSWLDEEFPKINEKWIETGKLKLRTQPVVFLNNDSLELAKFDQNLKEHYPNNYYDFLFDIKDEATKGKDEINVENYINKYIKTNDIDSKRMLAEPSINPFRITDEYSDEFNIDYVPMVILNGERLNDEFDLNEIEEKIKSE